MRIETHARSSRGATERLLDEGIQAAFGPVERCVLEGALVFETAAPALHFYATNRIDALRDRPADGSHRARLLPRMRERIEAIIAREGVFSVPKSVGLFICGGGSCR